MCQQTADALQLICHAQQARSSVLKLARSLAIELGLDPELNVHMGPIKTLERIWNKATGRKNGRVDLVTDICRERLELETARDVMALRKLCADPDFHDEWLRKGIDIIEFEDYFAYPNERGLRAINILLRVDLGKGRYHICELQVVHKDMVAVMKQTHDSYEYTRSIRESAASEGRELTVREKDILNEMEHETKARHDAVAIELGLPALEAPARHSQLVKLAA